MRSAPPCPALPCPALPLATIQTSAISMPAFKLTATTLCTASTETRCGCVVLLHSSAIWTFCTHVSSNIETLLAATLSAHLPSHCLVNVQVIPQLNVDAGLSMHSNSSMSIRQSVVNRSAVPLQVQSPWSRLQLPQRYRGMALSALIALIQPLNPSIHSHTHIYIYKPK